MKNYSTPSAKTDFSQHKLDSLFRKTMVPGTTFRRLLGNKYNHMLTRPHYPLRGRRFGGKGVREIFYLCCNYTTEGCLVNAKVPYLAT
jgi:hypothetical protein